MAYAQDEDTLYEVAYFAEEFHKIQEVIGQVFHTMNNAVQWNPAGGNGVAFHDFHVKTGTSKGVHVWWKYVSTKQVTDPEFSVYEDKILNIDKGLLYIILFAQRMNLYIGEVLDGNGDLQTCGLDADGNLVETLDTHELKRIGWISDPVEVLCSSLGEIFNVIQAEYVEGNYGYNNWGPMLRNVEGDLFAKINEKVYNWLSQNKAPELANLRDRPWEVVLHHEVKFPGTEV